MKNLKSIFLIMVGAVSLFGCSAKYTEDDIKAAYSQGYSEGYYNAEGKYKSEIKNYDEKITKLQGEYDELQGEFKDLSNEYTALENELQPDKIETIEFTDGPSGETGEGTYYNDGR